MSKSLSMSFSSTYANSGPSTHPRKSRVASYQPYTPSLAEPSSSRLPQRYSYRPSPPARQHIASDYGSRDPVSPGRARSPSGGSADRSNTDSPPPPVPPRLDPSIIAQLAARAANTRHRQSRDPHIVTSSAPKSSYIVHGSTTQRHDSHHGSSVYYPPPIHDKSTELDTSTPALTKSPTTPFTSPPPATPPPHIPSLHSSVDFYAFSSEIQHSTPQRSAIRRHSEAISSSPSRNNMLDYHHNHSSRFVLPIRSHAHGALRTHHQSFPSPISEHSGSSAGLDPNQSRRLRRQGVDSRLDADLAKSLSFSELEKKFSPIQESSEFRSGEDFLSLSPVTPITPELEIEVERRQRVNSADPVLEGGSEDYSWEAQEDSDSDFDGDDDVADLLDRLQDGKSIYSQAMKSNFSLLTRAISRDDADENAPLQPGERISITVVAPSTTSLERPATPATRPGGPRPTHRTLPPLTIESPSTPEISVDSPADEPQVFLVTDDLDDQEEPRSAFDDSENDSDAPETRRSKRSSGHRGKFRRLKDALKSSVSMPSLKVHRPSSSSSAPPVPQMQASHASSGKGTEEGCVMMLKHKASQVRKHHHHRHTGSTLSGASASTSTTYNSTESKTSSTLSAVSAASSSEHSSAPSFPQSHSQLVSSSSHSQTHLLSAREEVTASITHVTNMPALLQDMKQGRRHEDSGSKQVKHHHPDGPRLSTSTSASASEPSNPSNLDIIDTAIEYPSALSLSKSVTRRSSLLASGGILLSNPAPARPLLLSSLRSGPHISQGTSSRPLPPLPLESRSFEFSPASTSSPSVGGPPNLPLPPTPNLSPSIHLPSLQYFPPGRKFDLEPSPQLEFEDELSISEREREDIQEMLSEATWVQESGSSEGSASSLGLSLGEPNRANEEGEIRRLESIIDGNNRMTYVDPDESMLRLRSTLEKFESQFQLHTRLRTTSSAGSAGSGTGSMSTVVRADIRLGLGLVAGRSDRGELCSEAVDASRRDIEDDKDQSEVDVDDVGARPSIIASSTSDRSDFDSSSSRPSPANSPAMKQQPSNESKSIYVGRPANSWYNTHSRKSTAEGSFAPPPSLKFLPLFDFERTRYTSNATGSPDSEEESEQGEKRLRRISSLFEIRNLEVHHPYRLSATGSTSSSSLSSPIPYPMRISRESSGSSSSMASSDMPNTPDTPLTRVTTISSYADDKEFASDSNPPSSNSRSSSIPFPPPRPADSMIRKSSKSLPFLQRPIRKRTPSSAISTSPAACPKSAPLPLVAESSEIEDLLRPDSVDEEGSEHTRSRTMSHSLHPNLCHSKVRKLWVKTEKSMRGLRGSFSTVSARN
ncbi:hypothetical protein K474DRAFT_1410052 [Panus rudis PR-1116 ss-1]|nr:hypothetical protein K474DRAFT_1410052 [Panus rudis PR-1116 ss-1]